MNQQPALQVARRRDPLNGLEVLARVLVVPGGAPWWKRLQAQRCARAVAGDASGVTRTLRQKDRLHPGLEELEIERGRSGRSGCRLLAPQPGKQHAETENSAMHVTSARVRGRLNARPDCGAPPRLYASRVVRRVRL